jgi:transposase
MIKDETALKWKEEVLNGSTIIEISKKYGVFYSTVRRALARIGVVVPKLRSVYQKFSNDVIDEWGNLYLSGKTISEIAKQYYTSAGVVQNWLLEKGVQMRRERTFSEEHKQNLSKSCTGRESPNKGKPMSEEQKRKISESTKETMQTPEMREYISNTMKGKLSGNKHPSWQGGISYKYRKGLGPQYPAAFNKGLRSQIMERDNHLCQQCLSSKDLTIHHIDYNKHNNDPENLITACRSCNAKFNFDRDFWKLTFQKRSRFVG